jgi:hypothetical protein
MEVFSGGEEVEDWPDGGDDCVVFVLCLQTLLIVLAHFHENVGEDA